MQLCVLLACSHGGELGCVCFSHMSAWPKYLVSTESVLH